MKKRKLKSWIVVVFIILCSLMMIYSLYKIITWKQNVDENHEIKDEIEENIKTNNVNGTINYDIDFKTLKAQNADTIAYLRVNNTNIAYIVVKGTDNDYYLNHNFQKRKNVAGWIFADYRNKFDENDKNIIIYGHSTKDGSMFGTLKNILKSDWYENDENHKLDLVTEKGTYHYQVFSTYTIVPEDYYITTEFASDDYFYEFINKLKARSNYNYNVEVSKEDKILTLSSCNIDGSKRIVLHAKLIDKS